MAHLKPQIIRSFPILAVFLLMLILAGSVRAAEDGQDEMSGGTSPQVQEKIAQWKALREKDPAAFEAKMRERKDRVKSRMRQLKQDNPEQFENFKNHFLERRQARMENLRERNPEKYQQVMQKREQRFEQWKEKHPEKHQQFMQKHPGFTRRGQRQGQNPEGTGFQNPPQRQRGEEGPRFARGQAHSGEHQGNPRLNNGQFSEGQRPDGNFEAARRGHGNWGVRHPQAGQKGPGGGGFQQGPGAGPGGGPRDRRRQTNG